jgi:EmrB/QacA subfamily drug resistance transporter
VRRTPGGGHGWWPLIVLASAHLMVILDTTVMFVALPSVQRALGLSVTSRQWVVTAYTLAFAALLLLGGRLADRLGARRTLMIGAAGFACASAIGGASAGAAMLIAARAAQGAFGAVLVSSTKSLLITVYTQARERALAMGIFAATLTAGAAAGLLLGGVLTSGPGWRWCLYVNAPVALAAIAGAARVLPNLPGRPGLRLDVISALLASAGMTGLVYGLGEAASDGWGSAQVTGSLIASAVALAAFVIRQATRPGPLLPLRIVRDRNRGGALIALVVNSLSTFGMMLVLTYQLQAVMGYSPLRTGLALVPFAAAAALAAALIAPRLLLRVPPRWVITGGIVLSAAGLVPLTRLTVASHYLPLIVAATVIEGLGTGLAGPPALNTALRAVLPADAGAASALSSAASQLGSSVGAALLNTIAATATAAYLAAHAATAAAAGTVHGYTVAAGWGAAVLLVAAVPVGILVNVSAPDREPRAASEPSPASEPPRAGGLRRWSRRGPGSSGRPSGVRQP